MVATGGSARIVASFVSFLQSELHSYNDEAAESLDVAIQCLCEVYKLDSSMLADPTLPNVRETFKNLPSEKTDVKPENPEAERLKTLGNAHLAAKRALEAEKCYSQAIALDPTSAVYYSNRAAAYNALERYHDAIADAQKAIMLNPKYTKAYNRLGAAHYGRCDYDEAASAYQKALDLEPNNAALRSSLDASRRQAEANKAGGSNMFKPAAAPPTSPLNGSMPDLANMDIASLLGNPNFMNMASQMMSSGALNDILANPNMSQMMQNMMSNPEVAAKLAKKANRPSSPNSDN